MVGRIRVFASLGLVLAALAAGEGIAFAGDSAQDFIQSRQSQVTALLRQSASAQRDKQVAAVLDGMMDYGELAKRSLAAHWSELSDAQQKEFTDILKRLVQRNYERNIKNIQEYKVEYLGEEPGSDGVIVHTRASSTTNQREEPISIDYRLQQMGGSWKVVDIVTEGSSLVNNYKNQFHRIIQKDGYNALVKKMKDKLAKGQTA
ncbi:MAG TPA: ABC transporter substrate-binding protein [Polyangiaceae bacterium]